MQVLALTRKNTQGPDVPELKKGIQGDKGKVLTHLQGRAFLSMALTMGWQEVTSSHAIRKG